jgi:hypothetical protein
MALRPPRPWLELSEPPCVRASGAPVCGHGRCRPQGWVDPGLPPTPASASTATTLVTLSPAPAAPATVA